MKTKATKLSQKMNFKEVARHSFKHSLRFHRLTEASYHHQIASDIIKQRQQQHQQQQHKRHFLQQHSFFLFVWLLILPTFEKAFKKNNYKKNLNKKEKKEKQKQTICLCSIAN